MSDTPAQVFVGETAMSDSHGYSFGHGLVEQGEEPGVAAPFNSVILPFAPMEHQWEGFWRARFHTRAGLFFEPRTGKTLTMQMLAIFYAKYGVGTIQIMPPGLFRQFQHDYNLIRNHGLRIAVLSGTPAFRHKSLLRWQAFPEERPHVILLSKEIFRGAWKDIYLLGFTNVHFDESHLGLQNSSSQIARALRSFMAQHSDNRIVLSTGTPIPNKIQNAFGTLGLMAPESYKTKAVFENTHCIFKKIYVPSNELGRMRTISVVDSYVNLDYLSSVLYWRGVHASKREVLGLEAPNIQLIECELMPKHRKLYRKVMNERILEVKGEVLDARTAQKLRQVALQLISVPEQFSDNLGPGDNSVYATVEALLDSINLEKEKVVIFANYIRSVEALVHRFARHHPAKVYGPNGPNKNAAEVERFHVEEACRLLIANPLSGGAGFKLGDCSTTVIFAEPVQTPGAFDQCLSRVMLKGQTEPVVCYIVNVRDTISPLATEHMLNKVPDINKVMGTKKTLFDALLGKPVDYSEGPCEQEAEEELDMAA